MCASGGPSRPGRPFLASGGPLRPGVAKLEGVAFRCKGLLRKKEATPAFKLVQYATMGRQDARQCSSTAARHIAHTRIRQHAIAVARLQRRGGEAMQPDSKRIALPSATRIRQLASGVVVGAAAFGAEMGTRELEPSGSLAHGRRGCRATSTWRRVARARGRAAASLAWAEGVGPRYGVARPAAQPWTPKGGENFSRGLCQCISAKRATRPPLVPRFYLLRSQG